MSTYEEMEKRRGTLTRHENNEKTYEEMERTRGSQSRSEPKTSTIKSSVVDYYTKVTPKDRLRFPEPETMVQYGKSIGPVRQSIPERYLARAETFAHTAARTAGSIRNKATKTREFLRELNTVYNNEQDVHNRPLPSLDLWNSRTSSQQPHKKKRKNKPKYRIVMEKPRSKKRKRTNTQPKYDIFGMQM